MKRFPLQYQNKGTYLVLLKMVNNFILIFMGDLAVLTRILEKGCLASILIHL